MTYNEKGNISTLNSKIWQLILHATCLLSWETLENVESSFVSKQGLLRSCSTLQQKDSSEEEEEEEDNEYDLTDKFIAQEDEDEEGEEEDGSKEGKRRRHKHKRRRDKSAELDDDDYQLLADNQVTVSLCAG